MHAARTLRFDCATHGTRPINLEKGLKEIRATVVEKALYFGIARVLPKSIRKEIRLLKFDW